MGSNPTSANKMTFFTHTPRTEYKSKIGIKYSKLIRVSDRLLSVDYSTKFLDTMLNNYYVGYDKIGV